MNVKATLEYPVVLYTALEDRKSDRLRVGRAQRLVLNANWNARIDLRNLLIDLPMEVRLTRIAPKEMSEIDLRAAFRTTCSELAKLVGVDDSSRITWLYAQTKGKPKEHRVRIELY